MSTNKSFSNKSSRQLLTVSEHPPAFAGFLFSLSSFRSSPIYPFFEVRLSACILSDHSSSGSIALLSAPFSSCPSATHGSSSPNDTNSLKRYKLSQTAPPPPNA